MKKTIYKYFFYEFVIYFTVTLFALAAVVWTIQAVNYLDLVTEDGHAFTTYFFYSFLTLSKVFTKLIPFSFLIAILLTIIKLERDNELLVLWTSGLNKIYIVNHIFRIAVLVMFLQLLLTSTFNPSLLNLSRTLLKNSELQFIPSLLKEKQFNDAVEGLTIFVEEKDENNIYKNVFIRDEGTILSKIATTSSTIYAKSGHMSEDEKHLILYNGNIQKLNDDGNVNIVKFDKTILKYLLGSALKLQNEGWSILTKRWISFFVALAILNEIIWRTQTTDIWVNFKVFGILPITFLFTLSQFPILKKYQIND